MQLFGNVSVIDIEWSNTRLPRTQHRLEVLIAIVEIDGEMILPGLPAVNLFSLGMTAEALRCKVIGQLARTQIDVIPGESLVSKDETFLVWSCGSYGLQDFGDT